MIKKLLGLFAIGSIAAAQPKLPDAKLDIGHIYPYVVPSAYFQATSAKAMAVTWPLGHGLYVALVQDLDGAVRNILPEDLDALGLSAEEVKKKAIENLEALAKSGAIGQQRFAGPDQKPFVLFGGHWAAAACILLPGLHQMGVKNVGSEELCVCIPHREALLMFAKADVRYRDLMRAMIRERESDGRKPLTFDLFELTAKGLTELKE